MISRKLLIALAIAMLSVTALWAGQWTALGPDGGDVRSLSFDPQNPDRIYLGTSTGTLFLSSDGGHNWSRLAHLGGDDNVLDHIAIDPQNPKHIYVSAWSVVNQQAGDVLPFARWRQQLGSASRRARQIGAGHGHRSLRFQRFW